MKLTLGTTYYNNPEYLKKFVENNLYYVDELIVVDDGSPDPITNYLSPSDKVRLFKVVKDYGFNSHGCRNLIMTKTSNEFNILLDIDREFANPKNAVEAIKSKNLRNDTLYRFIAHSDKLGSNVHHSVNDFLISKTHFFTAGGYDEEIIGERWGDREYFSQLLHYGTEKTLYDVDIILTRSSSILIGECSPNNKPCRKNLLIENRIKRPDPNKPILTFKWEEIT